MRAPDGDAPALVELQGLLAEHEALVERRVATHARFPLDRAALLLAAAAQPGLDVAAYEARLDGYAERVAALLSPPGDPEPRRRLGALRRILFEEEGFHGNREEYYDLRNSSFPDVLERKLGIPITLAAVMLGVSRRLGWPMWAVNFPGHFLVRYEDPAEVLAVDAFHGGLILGPEDLEERWVAATGSAPPPAAVMLEPASPRAVLVRMVNNVRMVEHQRRDYAGAARATEVMALLAPGDPMHVRDLGYYRLAARDLPAAIRCLEAYLEQAPGAPDGDRVRDHLAMIRENLPPQAP